MPETLDMKPHVFQRDKRWYVGWKTTAVAYGKYTPPPQTHYVEPKIEFMCASFDDALIYAGYLANTRRDGVKEIDIPLTAEWRAS